MWKIFVVDDNQANRELLIEILRDVAVCDTACNGREALEGYTKALASNKPYDLILLDIAMPEVDGLVFLEQVRRMESAAGTSFGEGVPIIMVTAFNHPFMKAFNLGCDDYILKPVDPIQLTAKIKVKLSKGRS